MTPETIAIFLPNLAGGGAERVMLNLAAGFLERGFRVDMVVAGNVGPFASQVPAGVRLVDLGQERVMRSLPGLVRYLRRSRPPVLLTAMDHANLLGIWGRWLARSPVRVVASVHIALAREFLASQRGWAGVVLRMAWRAYHRADAVVSVSHGVAADLVSYARLPPDLVHVIHNPIVFPGLFVLAGAPLSDPWYAPGEPPLILGVGRLEPQKDFATLIRAVAEVNRTHAVRLRILGEGAERPALERLVRECGLEDRVSLPGFVENPFAHMRRARMLVMSSVFEGFGNVLVEAMACGTPVVSTDCLSGPAEILDHGRFGRLVPPGQPAALAAAISQSLGTEPDRERLRLRAEEFSVARAVDRYLRVLFPSAADSVPAGVLVRPSALHA